MNNSQPLSNKKGLCVFVTGATAATTTLAFMALIGRLNQQNAWYYWKIGAPTACLAGLASAVLTSHSWRQQSITESTLPVQPSLLVREEQTSTPQANPTNSQQQSTPSQSNESLVATDIVSSSGALDTQQLEANQIAKHLHIPLEAAKKFIENSHSPLSYESGIHITDVNSLIQAPHSILPTLLRSEVSRVAAPHNSAPPDSVVPQWWEQVKNQQWAQELVEKEVIPHVLGAGDETFKLLFPGLDLSPTEQQELKTDSSVWSTLGDSDWAAELNDLPTAPPQKKIIQDQPLPETVFQSVNANSVGVNKAPRPPSGELYAPFTKEQLFPIARVEKALKPKEVTMQNRVQSEAQQFRAIASVMNIREHAAKSTYIQLEKGELPPSFPFKGLDQGKLKTAPTALVPFLLLAEMGRLQALPDDRWAKSKTNRVSVWFEQPSSSNLPIAAAIFRHAIRYRWDISRVASCLPPTAYFLPDEEGNTAWHIAAQYYPEALKTLYALDPSEWKNLNALNKKRQTALQVHQAAISANNRTEADHRLGQQIWLWDQATLEELSDDSANQQRFSIWVQQNQSTAIQKLRLAKVLQDCILNGKWSLLEKAYSAKDKNLFGFIFRNTPATTRDRGLMEALCKHYDPQSFAPIVLQWATILGCEFQVPSTEEEKLNQTYSHLLQSVADKPALVSNWPGFSNHLQVQGRIEHLFGKGDTLLKALANTPYAAHLCRRGASIQAFFDDLPPKAQKRISYLATASGHIEDIRWLLTNEKLGNDQQQVDIVSIAVIAGHNNIVDLFETKKSSLNRYTKIDVSLLLNSLPVRRPQPEEDLLRNHSPTPFALAIALGNQKAAEKLLPTAADGLNRGSKTDSKCTAFYLAFKAAVEREDLRENVLTTLEWLIQQEGCDVSQGYDAHTVARGITPLESWLNNHKIPVLENGEPGEEWTDTSELDDTSEISDIG